MARAAGTRMNASIRPVRGSLQGVGQIIRFNWHYYAAALAALASGFGAALVVSGPARYAILLGLGLAGFWTLSSVIVSYYVYDLSPLCRWRWLSDLLTPPPRAWLHIHAGHDESSAELRLLFPASEGTVLDIYDPTEMSEPSITRARSRAGPSPGTERASYAALPVMDSACDAAFLIFSAHEIRDPSGRASLFRELRRILRPEGRLVLVEHLRDGWNLLAFGPGFTHFYPRTEWMRLAGEAGFSPSAEHSITPFVHCFILAKRQET